MEISRLEEVCGVSPSVIPGQGRIAYSKSSTEDFYDMQGWMEQGGFRGDVIRFYDLVSGRIFCPFSLKKNVVYGRPLYSEGCFFFLQGDFDAGKITLFRYDLAGAPEAVTELDIRDTCLYNLRLVPAGVHIVSEDSRTLRCYYPEQFTLELEPNETLLAADGGKVYIDAWIEEGWDSVHGHASRDYDFYSCLVIKDLSGNILSREKGSLEQLPDGKWTLF